MQEIGGNAMSDEKKQGKNGQQTEVAYESPQVETVLTSEDLERAVFYAGDGPAVSDLPIAGEP
jgi:carbamate kinase